MFVAALFMLVPTNDFGEVAGPVGTAIIALIGIVSTIRGFRRGYLGATRREWIRQGFCRRCGYNMTGNVSHTCPECGTPLPGREPRGALR